MAENTFLSREMAGRIYQATLIKQGITDPRLLQGMVEDFLRTRYDVVNPPKVKAANASGSSAYNFQNQKATPAATSVPPTAGMGMPTASPPVGKDDYIPPRGDFGGGTNVFTEGMQTGVPFYNPLEGKPSGVSLTSMPPAATMPTPNMRPQSGAPAQPSAGGFDPLPQTSGHVDVTSRSGQESMNPAQLAMLEKLLAAQRMV